MIVTKCPVRIGFVGGSSDLDAYMKVHGRGAVINLSIDIHTYILLHTDIIGYNAYYNKYIVNYSIREEVSTASEIQNDVIRTAFEYYNLDPCLVSMTSDVFSSGSGLASSSSYMVALLKAICISKKLNMSNAELASIAMQLERKFNPLLGYQDTYGCAIGGFKRFDFELEKQPKITYMPTSIIDSFDMHLAYTGVSRSSTKVLKSIRIPKDDSLLDLVDELQFYLENNDRDGFIDIINRGWTKKKEMSDLITANPTVKEMDETFERDSEVLCHKLCGAGNGGFFLLFCEKGTNIDLKYDYFCKKINISPQGPTGFRGSSV